MNQRYFSLTTLLILAGCATHPYSVQPADHMEAAKAPPADLPQPVSRPILLPKPTAQAKADTYSVVVSNVPVRDMLFALARDAKLNVDVHPLIKGTVTLNALNQTLPQILDRVAKQINLRYTLENGVLTVVPDTPYVKTYSIDYVNMVRTTHSTVAIGTSVTASGPGGASAKNSSTTDPDWAKGLISSAGRVDSRGDNTSDTTIDNTSENRFWERLEKNLRDILLSSRKAAAAEQKVRDELESKDEQRRTAEVAEQKAENERKQQDDRLKAAQSLANAGTAAPQLLSMVLGNDKAGAATGTDGTLSVDQDVIVHPETGVLSINATTREHTLIQAYLDQIDASAKRQVLIEATIVEVVLNNEYQTGVDWNIFKTNPDGTPQDNRINVNQQQIGTALGQVPYTTLTYTKVASGLLGGANITATIKALEQFGKTKVLSSPKLMALNNQTAILKVVDEKVYFTLNINIQAATANSPETRTYTSTLNTVPVGLVMSVTPQIGANNLISLNVRPTISRITGYKPDPAVAIVQALNPAASVAQSLVPEIQVREVESTLRLANGQTAILGGLIQDQVANQRNGTPFLSRLPLGVGDLFSTRDDVSQKTELVIFMRPVVVKEANLDGDLKHYRDYLPKEGFFEDPKDEISAYKSGTTAR
ncbi:MAG: pilus (MSHA type) biogenesis protein MshL [Burkholderiales bacterium]|nr:pilus (MSHA type) biogenesis protein MshL [Burkholderiales bacterium]